MSPRFAVGRGSVAGVETMKPLSERMRCALLQVARYGTYEGMIHSCRALARRGLLRWEHGRPIFQGYVLTDDGRRIADEAIARIDRAAT